jgi:hypothetical protein
MNMETDWNTEAGKNWFTSLNRSGVLRADPALQSYI